MQGIFRYIILFMLLLLVLFAAVFVSMNDSDVELWLGWTFAPRPAGIWLVLAFVCGGFLGLLLGYGLLRRLRYRYRIRRLEDKLAKLEEENARLQQANLKDLYE